MIVANYVKGQCTDLTQNTCANIRGLHPLNTHTPLDVVCRIVYTHCRQRPGLDTIFITVEADLTLAPTG